MHQAKCLSLLSAVEEAIDLNKAEAARINENIHQFREILRSMKAQPIRATEEEQSTVKAEEEPGLLPEEREEMVLLEQVLKKALRVRCGSGAPPRGPGAAGREGGDEKERVTVASNKVTSRPAAKSAPRPGTEGKGSRRSTAAPLPSRDASGRVCHRTGRGRAGVGRCAVWNQVASLGKSPSPLPSGSGMQSVSTPASGQQSHAQVSVPGGLRSACQSGLCAEDSGTARVTHKALCENPVPVTHAEGTGAGDSNSSAQKGDGKPSIAPSVWRAQRTKYSRLWDKVLATQSQPMAEKTRFIERLRTTLPAELPRCSPVAARAEVGRLSQLCGALAHLQMEVLAARAGGPPGSGVCWEMEYEALLMQEGLEKVVLDLLRRVELMKRDCDARDRWRPSRCCPVRRKGRWGDPAAPRLPPVLTYTSVAELKELEGLRLRVALLQQELHLHQALRECLTPCWTSALSDPGLPSASILRSLYSLLGEGGVQFPAVVLDTESE